MTTDDERCPFCDTVGVPILWGMPSPEFLDTPHPGVVLGGCCVSDESAKYSCPQCALQWGRYLRDEDIERP